jgi:selenocysteine lyase/cysteine desulfurase
MPLAHTGFPVPTRQPPLTLAAFRALFPLFRRGVWLNCAGVGPGARPVTAALRKALVEWGEGTFDWMAWEARAEESRTRFAARIGADPRSVALLSTLSDAAATVAHALPPLSPGSAARVVVPEMEFRSNLFPWLALGERGYRVQTIPQAAGVLRTDDILQAITPGVVLVAVSEVQSSTGSRIDAAPIVQRCDAVGARLFLNLTQSLGALRFDTRQVPAHFVAAHGYKWLLAPRGATWLHVRTDCMTPMRPLAPNWKDVECPYERLYGGPYALAASAQRLDASLAWLSWVGAREALRMLDRLDPVVVERVALARAAEFRQAALDLDFEVAASDLPSPLVGVRVVDAAGACHALQALHLTVSARDGWLRFSFHAFNTTQDVLRARNALHGVRTASRIRLA